MSHDHHHGADHSGHSHGVSADADRRWLTVALLLILSFMGVEIAVGLIASSLALLSDAAHMLTDAGAIALALVAARLAARPAGGKFTFGLGRAEIISAQINGASLLVLASIIAYEAIHRLIDPPNVDGGLVIIVGLLGAVVNVAAAWALSRAERQSLNVEGARQHVLADLYASLTAATAGLVVVVAGFARADGIAALVVAALMIRSGWRLVRDSGRILLEAAPEGMDPQRIGSALVRNHGVAEVHDLHVWEVTSGFPALAAHVLVAPGDDCHAIRRELEDLLEREFDIRHTTLQVDHEMPRGLLQLGLETR